MLNGRGDEEFEPRHLGCYSYAFNPRCQSS